MLGASKEQLNLVFLKPKRAACDATISMILADRTGIKDSQELKKYTDQFTGKHGATNLVRIRLKVAFYTLQGEPVASAVTKQAVVDNGSKRIGCMDMYEAWPRRSCSRGGRKVVMISEYELAEDVEPVFELYDTSGK